MIANKDSVAQLFLHLGQDIGLPTLKMDEERLLSLVFDNKYFVEAQTSVDYSLLHLLAVVSPTPMDPTAQARIYASLMAMPLENETMSGATFVVDQSTEEILLLRTLLTEGLTSFKLQKVLEGFVNTLEYWQEQLHQGVLDPDARGAAPDKSPSATVNDMLTRV